MDRLSSSSLLPRTQPSSSIQGGSTSAAAAAPPIDRGPSPEGGFRAVLRTQLVRVAEAERVMDAAVRGSLGGRTLDTSELLAIQAGVYRYGQELELISRLVDRASAAVKQTLQSQS